jgi:leukotriene-A4 hydrolase
MNASTDPHSFAVPAQAKVTDTKFDLSPNFQTKILHGIATLTIEKKPNASEVILDIDQLNIEIILVNGKPITNYNIGETKKWIGEPLKIPLPSGSTSATVEIKYHTCQNPRGLFWRDPDPANGNPHPLMYTHNQPTYASSWLPVQTALSVRGKYHGILRTPKELMGLAATPFNPVGKNSEGVYEFRLPVDAPPIPSYLFGIAVGDFEYVKFGQRTGAYAEPSAIHDTAKDFCDNEKLLDDIIDMLGPFMWHKYNMLVLRNDYAAGAMEEANLSKFARYYITGDGTRKRVAFHELAHYYSGNVVTAATWGDLWLNEGLTTYIESRIGYLRDKKQTDLEICDQYQTLLQSLESMPAELTCLKVHLDNRNPRDNFTAIPYYKGSLFFRELERMFSVQNLDLFLKYYINKFKFKSISTEMFEQTLLEWMQNNKIDFALGFDLKAWLYQPGLQKHIAPSSDLAVSIRANIHSIVQTGKFPLSITSYSGPQMVFLLNGLVQAGATIRNLDTLDEYLNFNSCKDLLTKQAWYKVVIKLQHEKYYSDVIDFLLIRKNPNIVSSFFKIMTSSEEGTKAALAVYFHPLQNFDARAIDNMKEILNNKGINLEDAKVKLQALQYLDKFNRDRAPQSNASDPVRYKGQTWVNARKPGIKEPESDIKSRLGTPALN